MKDVRSELTSASDEFDELNALNAELQKVKKDINQMVNNRAREAEFEVSRIYEDLGVSNHFGDGSMDLERVNDLYLK